MLAAVRPTLLATARRLLTAGAERPHLRQERSSDAEVFALATDPSALQGCALGDAWDCERSQPDGPFFPEAFCEGEDVVCGITNGGNPICRQCGSGDGEAQEGCPCDVVGDCEMYGLGCWGDGWGVTGRCWDQDEPPDHICIEECSELHDDEGYQLVCVGPHTGHDDGTPHSVGSQFAGHPSYCTTDSDCGAFTFCEVNGGNVCTWTESSGYECGAQCESDGECGDRGYPSWYSCSSLESLRSRLGLRRPRLVPMKLDVHRGDVPSRIEIRFG